jgi:hypothetical protein
MGNTLRYELQCYFLNPTLKVNKYLHFQLKVIPLSEVTKVVRVALKYPVFHFFSRLSIDLDDLIRSPENPDRSAQLQLLHLITTAKFGCGTASFYYVLLTDNTDDEAWRKKRNKIFVFLKPSSRPTTGEKTAKTSSNDARIFFSIFR